MAAALAAREAGIEPEEILILERDGELGGILRQCIHNGFGLHRFGEELTGPEYAYRFIDRVQAQRIGVLLNTTVCRVHPDRTVIAMSPTRGCMHIRAGALILAMGCRERPRGALSIAGSRPAGILTAGTAQKFVNRMGYLPGKRVVILGSGDIGLIMARRMTLEGAKVEAVCELMPYSGGLARNIEQCLHDFDIPLKLSHTVTQIHGRERITGVTVSAVDGRRMPIAGTEQRIPCDTLLLSCGLLPENELSCGAGIPLDRVTGGALVSADRQTRIPGIFACGNVLHVHDLVDFVSDEAQIAGEAAARYVRGERQEQLHLSVLPGEGVRYTVPQCITRAEDTGIYFRVRDVSRDKRITVRCATRTLYSKKTLRLAPGEMQSVTLTAAMIKEAGTEPITVSLSDGQNTKK